MASLILAGLSTPLVLSVHTVVSFDFAVAVMPGWHATIFPPYFVAGAVFAGFAMVLTLAIPLRRFFGLEDFITVLSATTDNVALLDAVRERHGNDPFQWLPALLREVQDRRLRTSRRAA